MDGGFYWLRRAETQRVSQESKEAPLKYGADAAAH